MAPSRHLLFRLAALLFVATAASPESVSGQTLLGRVLEEGRETPVASAAISLLDRDGRSRASTLADSLGRFVLTPPEAGEYIVESVGLGFETTRSPLLAMTVSDTVPFEITMFPIPLGLEGLEVSVDREAEQMLGIFGHTPASLRNRWIDRETIEKMPLSAGPREIIRWQNIAGLSVMENSSGDIPTLCVMFQRGRTGGGLNRCALIFLNGMRIPSDAAQAINPSDIESIAVLTPVDASTFYGTNAGGGAVLMWTRRGN